MNIAEYVQPILAFFKCICYLILIFYLIRITIFIFFGKKNSDLHRLREAMALAYTFVAAIFVYKSIKGIQPFIQNILEAVVQAYPLVALCSGLVFTAFICNFSRALWMLKSLDHAMFEPVPNWETLSSARTHKLVFEFLTRTTAALLFIRVELELDKLSTSSLRENITKLASGASPHSYLAVAGLFALFLYICLSLWWVIGFWIAKSKMPKSLLWFYIGGFVNSLMVFYYGGTISHNDPIIMKGLFVVVSIAGLYMLFYIFIDIYKGLKDLARILKNLLGQKNDSGLANAQ